jgi:integral membrane protein
MHSFSLNDPVGRVRAVGWLEGVSYLLLLGVAMPLKYLADMPEAVRYVGWAHGLLFMALLLQTAIAWLGRSLTFRQALMVGVASLLPFGPFVIDRRLAKAEGKAGD